LWLLQFINTANAMIRMMGVPDFDYVIAQHPLFSLTDTEVKERAAQIAPDVERVLLGSNTRVATGKFQ